MRDRTEKKEWILTEEALDGLLSWLDSDRNHAGERYVAILQKLLKYFRSHGCISPEDLADETINRVIGKVPQLAPVYVGDPALYFFGVARNVHREYLRKSLSTVPLEGFDVGYEQQFEIEDEIMLPEQEFVALAMEAFRKMKAPPQP